MSAEKYLIVIVGPTAVGKTAFSVRLAKQLNCDVISSDSRQFFSEMSIGTAKPTLQELQGVPHHFLDFLHIYEEMSAGSFETMVLELLDGIFSQQQFAILTGGSGLYVKAVCEGMSEMPTPPPHYREDLMLELQRHGLQHLLDELGEKDPRYFEVVDKSNHQRVVRALEMIRFTGKPFAEFRDGKKAQRNFGIIKIGLELEREILYQRINDRVDAMLKAGLLDEVKELYPQRNLNALQTVGYKEFFDHLEGKYDFEEAVRLVKRNTRRYAKRQMTWFKKDTDIKWFSPAQYDEVWDYIRNETGIVNRT